MATYDDLTPLPYFGDDWAEVLVAVGWLGRSGPYSWGPIEAAFVEALVNQLRDPWEPVAGGGFHKCEFCRLNEAPPTLSHAGIQLTMGVSNLFIPGDGTIYCAPSLIAHYIDAHEYRPPEAFMRAVLECPPASSIMYKKRLLACGGQRLLLARDSRASSTHR